MDRRAREIFRWNLAVLHNSFSGVKLVRGAGLEPASLAALEPKSRAFANFANRAEKNLRYYNTECTTFKPISDFSRECPTGLKSKFSTLVF